MASHRKKVEMAWFHRVRSVRQLDSDCACHDPGQLHQTDFRVDNEWVRVMEDGGSGEYFVAFDGRTVGEHLSQAEAIHLVTAHFPIVPVLPDF